MKSTTLYQWKLSTTVTNKHGRKRSSLIAYTIGSDLNSVKNRLAESLKKKKWKLVRINKLLSIHKISIEQE